MGHALGDDASDETKVGSCVDVERNDWKCMVRRWKHSRAAWNLGREVADVRPCAE